MRIAAALLLVGSVLGFGACSTAAVSLAWGGYWDVGFPYLDAIALAGLGILCVLVPAGLVLAIWAQRQADGG